VIKKPLPYNTIFLVISFPIIISLSYLVAVTEAPSIVTVFALSIIPLMLALFRGNRFLFLCTMLTSLKIMIVYTGLFDLDYFYVDGEGYYNGYLAIKSAIEGSLDGNVVDVGNIHLGVGGYYYFLEKMFATNNFDLWLSVNQVLILLTAFLWVRINNSSLVSRFSVVLLLVSPDSIIYSIYIGKEAILLFLAVAALSYVMKYIRSGVIQHREKMLLFVIIVAGSFMRPYFVCIILSYLVLISPEARRFYGYILFSYFLSFVFLVNHYGLYNIGIISRNFFANYFALYLSPNFFRITNWQVHFAETAFHTFGLIILLGAVFHGLKSNLVKHNMMSVLLYAIPLASVVILYSHHVDSTVYAFFMPRSRFPVILVFFTLISQSLVQIVHSFKYTPKAIETKC